MDGWLVYGSVNDQIVNRLDPLKLPYVILGDHRCVHPISSANVDHVAVGRMAVEHLASLGHRRIAFLGGSMRFVYQEQTRRGFCNARKEMGTDDDERLLTDHTVWSKSDPIMGMIYESNREHVLEWVRSIAPTALLSSEPNWGPEMYRVLRQAQIEVPVDMSLLACEPDSVGAKSQNFTRLELPMAEVGRQGARLLRKMTLNPRMEPATVMIPPSLIQGWSTCPPRDTGVRQPKTTA